MLSKLPSDWEVVRLGDVARIYDGTHQTPDYTSEGIPFYSVEHVTSGDFMHTKYVSRDVFEKENKRVKIEKGDILMTRIGDVGTAKYIDWDAEASFYVSLALIKCNSHVDSRFITKLINSEEMRREIWGKTLHVAFPNKINLGDIGKCRITIPDLENQRRIVAILETWEKSIDILNKRIDFISAIRQGLSSRLFSSKGTFEPELRFPSRRSSPSIVSFFDLISLTLDFRGRTPLKIGMDWGGDIPSLSALNVKNGYVDFSLDANMGSEALYRKWMTKGDLKKDDILFTMEAPLGNVALVPDDRKYILSQRVIALRTKDIILSKYLYHYMRSPGFQSQIDLMSTGSTAKGINQKSLARIKVQVPSIDEQEKVVSVLNSYESELSALERKKKLLIGQKKYLYSNLLTGKLTTQDNQVIANEEVSYA